MNVIKTNFKYTKPLIPLNIKSINYIIVHHAEAVTASPEDIHEWHLSNGWSGAGYNEYIRKDGTVYIMRGDRIGAQCQGYNSISYGICCEGDYSKELIMPEAQKNSLVERIKYNSARFPNYKLTAPHYQFTSTECPGKNFPLAEILKRIEVKNMTVQEALKVLVDKGIINSVEYWQKAIDTVKNLDQLIINFAQKIA